MKRPLLSYPQAPLCLKFLIAFFWAWATAGALEMIKPSYFPAVAALFLLGALLFIRRRIIRVLFLLFSLLLLFSGIVFFIHDLVAKTVPIGGVIAFLLGWGGLRLFRVEEVKKYYYECSLVRAKRKTGSDDASGQNS